VSYADIYKGEAYLEKNPSWHVEESPFKAKYILKLLEQNDLSPARICEVGCGAGEVLKQLQDKMGPGHEFWGYDISPAAHRLSEPRANDKLHFELADPSKDANLFYDLMLVLDVVEHVEDYFDFLRKIRHVGRHKLFHFPLDLSVQAVMRKNGIMKRREMHAHLHYFTKELALQALIDTGYEIQDFFYAPRSNEIGPSVLQKAFRLPRAVLYAMNRDFAVRLLGGYSFMVLAR
jgi:SAM-dependent methyltransferase